MITFPQQFEVECVDKRVALTDGSSTPTSVSANKLIDTAADFSNVIVGDYVTLADAPQKYTLVTVVDSGTELTLEDDIILGTDYEYAVLSKATAFQLEVDVSAYAGETVPNLKKFLSVADGVDTNGYSLDYTVSGCKVVSVDSNTQCTIDIPVGGDTTIYFNSTNHINSIDVSEIDFVLVQEQELVLAGPFGKTAVGYAKIELNGLPGDAPVGVSNSALLMSDVLEAIVDSVSGSWQSAPAVNTRALGGGRMAFG